MLIKREREKLLNAIVYFARHTDCCGKTKLIKLLSILDFEHFKQTGRSITGMEYYAWNMGPVPIDFYGEIDCPPEDLIEHITITSEPTAYSFPFIRVTAKKEFDPSFFSKRELRILEEVAVKYKSYTGTQMIEITHHQDGPWAKVWSNGEGKNNLIPYEIVLDNNYEAILDAMLEHKEIAHNYS